MKTCIVAVVYLEDEWKKTMSQIERCDVPIFYVDRNPSGIGGLADAINRGFKTAMSFGEYEYIWFVTNVNFRPGILKDMIEHMDGFAAIHPCFESDHKHIQPVIDWNKPVYEVPFVEFTCPLVRTSIFKDFPLDEKMPYVGHDLDWGYRVTKAGHKIGVYHKERIGHTYIRNNKIKSKVTIERKRLRSIADKETWNYFHKKYAHVANGLRFNAMKISKFYHIFSESVNGK